MVHTLPMVQGVCHAARVVADRSKGRKMERTLWKVTLRADGGRYAHLIVSGVTEDDAIDAACNIELAPRRSVVSVEVYRESN